MQSLLDRKHDANVWFFPKISQELKSSDCSEDTTESFIGTITELQEAKHGAGHLTCFLV